MKEQRYYSDQLLSIMKTLYTREIIPQLNQKLN